MSLHMKRFTYQLFKKGLPSAGQTTILHYFKSLFQAFFSRLKTALISQNIREYIR